MDVEFKINPENKATQIVSKWSNGNVHFVLEYGKNGKWKDGSILTYYMDGTIESNYYYKDGIIDGEALEFKYDDVDVFSKGIEEFKNFLNE